MPGLRWLAAGLLTIACLSSAQANDLRLDAAFAPAGEDGGAQLDLRIANDGNSELRDFRFSGGAITCADETSEGAGFSRADGLLEAGDSVSCSFSPRAGSGRVIVTARDDDGRWHKVEHGYYVDAPAAAGRGVLPTAQALVLIGAVHDDADFGFDFTPGETVDFTFTVVNTGEVPLDNINVTDTLGTTITCPPGPLAPGEALVCTSTYVIQAGDDPIIMENEADLAAEGNDLAIAAQDSIFMIAGFTADARMFKAPLLTDDGNGDGFAGPGDIVGYRFVIKNSSAEDLTLDSLNDPLPGLGAIDCPAETLGGNPFSGIPGGALVSGDTVMCSAEYTITEDDRDEGQVNNTAAVEAISDETFSFVFTGASATVTVPSAMIIIEKISLGGTGTFEFVLDNAEDSPITITTTVPDTPESSGPIHIDNLNDVDLVISETDPAPDWVLLDAVCSDGTDTWMLEDGSITIPAGTIVPGAEFGCEFVNGTAPEITTDKDLVDEGGEIDGQAEAGELLTYEITLINTGFAPKPGHPVVDDLDEHVVFVSADNGGAYDAATHQASWTVDVPAADDNGPGVVVLTIVVQVVDPIPDGVLAIGNVAYDPDDGPPDCDDIPQPPNCSDPLPTEPNVSDRKDLVDESGVIDGVAEAGEELTYEITLTNTGGSMAENHVQIDQLDANVTFVSADMGGVYDAGSHQVTWTVDVPAADDNGPGVVVLTIVVQVVDPIPAGVTEIGNVTYNPDDGPPDCDVVDPPPNCSDPLPTEPNVSDRKHLVGESGAIDGVAEAGEELTYEITLTNSGGVDAENYVQIDQLDPNVMFVTADNGGVHDGSATGGEVTWEVTVPANGVLVLTVVVQVVDPIPDGVTEIGNVTYNPDDGPPDCDVVDPPPNCSDPLPTEPNVSDSKELVAESGDIDGVAEAGEALTYEITLTNTGGTDAEDRVQIDQLDANVIFVSADNGGTHDGSATGGEVTWTVTVPAADDDGPGVLVLTVVVQVVDPIPADVTEIGNVTYTPDDGPPDCDVDDPPPNCSDPLPTEPQVTDSKGLVAESGEIDGVAEAGEALTYEITLTNSGGIDAEDYVQIDQLDPNVMFISADNGGVHDGSATGGEVTWTVTVPAADDDGPGVLVLTVVVQVVDPIPDGVTEIGNVTYNPGHGPPDCDVDDPPPNCSDPLPTEPQVIDSKALVAESGDIDGTAEAGEQLTYEITLVNNGGSDAENHVQIDQLDPNVVFVTADNGGVHDGAASGGEVTWNVTIPAADDGDPGVLVLTVVVEVVNPIPAGVTSIANVTYNPDIGPPDCDDVPQPPNCTEIPTDPRQPVLDIDKQVAPPVYAPGESGVYSLAISVEEGVVLGAGPVEVTDPMPAPLVITGTVSGVDWDCTASTETEAICIYTGAYPVAVGDMVGGVITIPFTVPESADSDDSLVNVATVTYGPEQATADADASVVIEFEAVEPIAVPIDGRWMLWLLVLMFLSVGLGNLLISRRRYW